MNGKPAIAPKPQLRSNRLKVTVSTADDLTSCHSHSSSDSHSGSLSLKEPKSTTV